MLYRHILVIFLQPVCLFLNSGCTRDSLGPEPEGLVPVSLQCLGLSSSVERDGSTYLLTSLADPGIVFL